MMVTKSQNDNYQYRALVLQNGLRVLLLSDYANARYKNDESGIDEHLKSLHIFDRHELNCNVGKDGTSKKVQQRKRLQSEPSNSSIDLPLAELPQKARSRSMSNVHMVKTQQTYCTHCRVAPFGSCCSSSEDGLNTVYSPDHAPGNTTDAKNSKMAAVSLCVGVGSYSDPDDVPGLAHFLEHMLFMGSEKYPKENDFDAFIQSHGGYDNAFTEQERTVYYFEINPSGLESGLDRFAHFFINPLLKEDSVDRELEAIDSEFKLNLQKDTARRLQLLALSATKKHDVGKFVWGGNVVFSATQCKSLQAPLQVGANLGQLRFGFENGWIMLEKEEKDDRRNVD